MRLKLFRFASDAETGTIESTSLQAAFDKLKPTDEQLANGACLWVEDCETGDRIEIVSLEIIK